MDALTKATYEKENSKPSKNTPSQPAREKTQGVTRQFSLFNARSIYQHMRLSTMVKKLMPRRDRPKITNSGRMNGGRLWNMNELTFFAEKCIL